MDARFRSCRFSFKLLVKSVVKLSLIPISIFVSDYISFNIILLSTLVYTDGSVFEDKVGVAVYIPSLIFLLHIGVLMVSLYILLNSKLCLLQFP